MAGPPTPLLSDQLCFDLYAASRALTKAYRPALKAVGLTYPQYLVLLVLWEREQATVRDLGEALQLDHGTLTPLLRRMESSGLVTRERDLSDERIVQVGLTERSDALRVHATRIHCDMKDALALDDDDFAALQTTLRVLTTRTASPLRAVAG